MRNACFPARHRPPRSATGFSLVELLVALAVVMVVAGVVVSNFKGQMTRMRLEGDAVAISNTVQRARAQALRYSTAVVGEINPTRTNELRFFFDVDDDLQLTAEDQKPCDADPPELICPPIPPLELSAGKQPEAGVFFWPADKTSPDPANAFDDLTSRTTAGLWPALVIEPNGSVRDLGGIRVGMGRFPTSNPYDANWMEVRVVTLASGRTEVRKFIPGAIKPASGYQVKMKVVGEGTNWKFY